MALLEDVIPKTEVEHFGQEDLQGAAGLPGPGLTWGRESAAVETSGQLFAGWVEGVGFEPTEGKKLPSPLDSSGAINRSANLQCPEGIVAVAARVALTMLRFSGIRVRRNP